MKELLYGELILQKLKSKEKISQGCTMTYNRAANPLIKVPLTLKIAEMYKLPKIGISQR